MSAMTVPAQRKSHKIKHQLPSLTVFVQVFAESFSAGVSNTLEHQVKSSLSDTDRTHAVVNTTRSTKGCYDMWRGRLKLGRTQDGLV